MTIRYFCGWPWPRPEPASNTRYYFAVSASMWRPQNSIVLRRPPPAGHSRIYRTWPQTPNWKSTRRSAGRTAVALVSSFWWDALPSSPLGYATKTSSRLTTIACVHRRARGIYRNSPRLRSWCKTVRSYRSCLRFGCDAFSIFSFCWRLPMWWSNWWRTFGVRRPMKASTSPYSCEI